MPPASPRARHDHQTDEALLVLDDELQGAPGDQDGTPGPLRSCSATRRPARLHRLCQRARQDHHRRLPAGSTSSSPPAAPRPGPATARAVPPDPAHLSQLTAAHGIQVLPSPTAAATAHARRTSHRATDPPVTDLVIRARNGDSRPGTRSSSGTPRWSGPSAAGTGWTVPTPGRRPDRLAAPGGPPGQAPRPGRASRLAGHHHPAGMRPGPARGPGTAGCRVPAGPGEHPDQQAATAEQETAHGRAPRGAARGLRPAPDCQRLLALLTGPARALRRDQRPAGHPRRQHRAHPQPLPGQAAPQPGHRRTDRRGRYPGSRGWSQPHWKRCSN